VASRRSSSQPRLDDEPHGARPVRVLLVDDSLIVRSVLERIIGDAPGLEVCASLSSASAAIDWLAQGRADIIILDIEMPGMTGLDALPQIVAQGGQARVLILSSIGEAGGPAAVRALALGASDTLAKPGRGSFAGKFTEVLLARVHALAERPAVTAPLPPLLPAAADHGRGVPSIDQDVGCIAVAASTGGIPAFSSFLAHLDRENPAPILLTQHLPDAFINYYAQQIAQSSKRPVRVAAGGMRVEAGIIYLAPGDAHLSLARVGRHVEIVLDRQPVANGCCPSADPMFAAAASVYGSACVAVVLSGMGRDGAEGASLVRSAGGMVLAQAPESCVIWGMPGAAVNNGAATAVLNPDAMAVLIGNGRVRR
jgi:two-component system, chemotaxis family, protein-glutamate methylesterase/glutaminase